MTGETLSIVDLVNHESMQVSWDLGRRCNFDCSYCPSHRHDSTSAHATLEELQSSARFMFEYLSLLMPQKASRWVSVSFTGGEPLINPNFIEFGRWLKQEYIENYRDKFRMTLAVTSNGATSQAMCDNLVENFNFVTISYHCEGELRLRQKVVENILYLNSKKFPMKVNVMFHAQHEYFEECKTLCELLASNGIKFVPRMIGEFEDKNLYHHEYTNEQMAWMKEFWQVKKETKTCAPKAGEGACEGKAAARSLGRPCCGTRQMNVTGADRDGWETTKFLSYAKFKDWHCSVNWFFLHIEQQTGQIYHHQTCKADFGGKRGAIGTLQDSGKILAKLRADLESQNMPVIVCPNKICGCGLCLPKADNLGDFRAIMARHVKQAVYDNNPEYQAVQPTKLKLNDVVDKRAREVQI